MWIRREFEWADDDRFGVGWRSAINPSFDTVRGFGVAHDVMEHFTQDGSLVDEAHAFGSMLWGRVQGEWVGWRASNYQFGKIMAGDASEFIVQTGRTLPLRAPAKPLKDEALEWHVQSLQRAIPEQLPEMMELFNPMYHLDRDGELHARLFCDFVRDGYRKAHRRWAHRITPETWADMFETINKHPLTNNDPESENDKLIIQISPKLGRVWVTIKEYVDPFYR